MRSKRGVLSMHWFRRQRVIGAQAALFALAVQFVVAFGHVHALDADHDAAVANVAVDPFGPPPPSDRGNPTDEPCAICATLHVTDAAQVAAPPTLPYPVNYRATELSCATAPVFADPRCFELRSRGPP